MNASYAAHRPGATPAPRRAGFTVTELLVVISLIVILILIAVPGFQAMIRSSDGALAETQLRAALRVARDAALRSSGRGDGAAVFYFDRGGRTRVVPCVKVADLLDQDASGNDVTREVFAPAPGLVATELPRGWSVRAYVPAGAIEGQWYARYAGAPESNQTSWLFPETDFYDDGSSNGTAGSGKDRSTFMVRFEAGSGIMIPSPATPALVISPRASAAGRTGSPFVVGGREYRADRADDLGRFVRRVVTSPDLDAAQRRQLVGRESADMVLARPVTALALYEERELGSALGIPLDRDSGTIYKWDPAAPATAAAYVAGGPNPASEDTIRRWLTGDTNFDGAVVSAAASNNPSAVDAPLARLFAIDRTSGLLRPLEVQP